MVAITKFEFQGAVMNRLKSALAVARRKRNLRLHQIVQSLIWIGEGETVAEVARRLGISCQTIYNWLWEFAARKFSWLAWHHFQGRGRKSKLSVRQKKELYGMIAGGPEKNGFNCGVWNSAMIAELIFSRFGVVFNPRYICSLLKKMGLSFQKAKFISDKVGQEEYELARTEWKEKTRHRTAVRQIHIHGNTGKIQQQFLYPVHRMSSQGRRQTHK